MQTTLLAVGVAIILALLTAVVGPFFVNWSDYRGLFEAQATRMIGMPVRITGDVDARLLPVPSVTLRGVTIGSAPRAVGAALADDGGAPLQVGEIGVEFSLGSLVRGEWRATELRLDGIDAVMAVNGEGHLSWFERRAAGRGFAFEADAFPIERLAIRNARIRIDDAAMPKTPRLIESLWFLGDARSLAGPVKGEGGFATDRARYGYRLSLGRAGDDGVRIRLSIDPADRPVTADAEGQLKFDDGVPRFDGSVSLAKLQNVAQAQPQDVPIQPWRIASRVKADPSSVDFEQIDLVYGPDDRSLRVGGNAQLRLGREPALDARLTARQLDLDRLVALPEGTRRLPMVILRHATVALNEVLQPTIPARIAIAVDALTLGGAAVQGLRGDFVAQTEGWRIEELQFRAPGFAQIRASGRWGPLTDGRARGYAFEGPAAIEAVDPRGLAAWLEGRSSVAAAHAAPIGALRATGALVLAGDRVAIDHLKAEVDGNEIAGRLTFVPGDETRKARLDAALNAAQLDIDAAVALVENAFPGVAAGSLPDLSLELDIGHARIAGISARDMRTRLRVDDEGLYFEPLSFADFAGIAIDLRGRIAGPWTAPRGSLTFSASGSRLEGAIALLQDSQPALAERLRNAASDLAPARLKGSLTVGPAPRGAVGASVADIALEGRAGTLDLVARGRLSGIVEKWEAAAIETAIDIKGPDGGALARAFSLTDTILVGSGAGSLRLTAHGQLDRDVNVAADLTVAGASASAKGTMRRQLPGLAGRGEFSLAADDVVALRQAMGRFGRPTPAVVAGTLAISPDRIALDRVRASLGESTVNGRLALVFADRLRLEGRLEADTVSASALAGALVGLPSASERQAALWPAQPFSPNFLGGLEGQLELAASRAAFGNGPEIRQFRSVLRFGSSGAALEDVTGLIAGGKLIGNFAFPRSPDGTSAELRLAISGADLALLMPGDARALASGRVSMQVEAKGTGRSAAALVGGLGGAGSISFKDVELSGLDPQVFDVATRATDQGVEVDGVKVARLVESALSNGRLRVPEADGTMALTAGQLRLGGLLGKGERADLAVSASLDLSQWILDARLALIGRVGEDSPSAGRPEVFIAVKGPPARTTTSIDVSALVGWLTLRSVELQARKLEQLESERRGGAAPGAAPAGTRPGTERTPPDRTPAERSPPDRIPASREPSGGRPAGNQPSGGGAVKRQDLGSGGGAYQGGEPSAAAEDRATPAAPSSGSLPPAVIPDSTEGASSDVASPPAPALAPVAPLPTGQAQPQPPASRATRAAPAAAGPSSGDDQGGGARNRGAATSVARPDQARPDQSRPQQAPLLPPPVDIRPAPAPRRPVAKPNPQAATDAPPNGRPQRAPTAPPVPPREPTFLERLGNDLFRPTR